MAVPRHEVVIVMGESTARRFGGAWYLIAPIASLGLLGCVPFWHAAGRLRRVRPAEAARARSLALVFTAVLVGQLSFSSVRATGAVGGLLGLGTMIAAPILARPYRALVYGLRPPRGDAAGDPIAAARLARGRREEARRLVERDPALAVDLGIGRPGSSTGYDDGGLLDLNLADAEEIGRLLGLSLRTAERIVVERDRNGGAFTLLDEVITFAELTEGEALRVRDHGVLLPR